MKRLSLLAALLFAAAAFPVHAADVTLIIQGINDEGGNIRTAICDRETFGGYSCPYKQQIPTGEGEKRTNAITVTFHDIPAGDWAAIAIHDSNLNGKLDENFLGIPTEQFGFSRNPGYLHKPDFSESNFTVATDAVTQSIDLSK